MEDIYNCSYEESDRTIASVANLVNGSTNTSATCNGTVLEDAPMLTSTALIKAVVLASMAVASLIGNVVTLLTITITKKLGTKSSLYTLLFQVSLFAILN